MFVGHALAPVVRHGHWHRGASHPAPHDHVITAVADQGETVSLEDAAVDVAAGEDVPPTGRVADLLVGHYSWTER